MLTLPVLNHQMMPHLRAAIDGKAKPLGSLGRIEDLAIQIGLITQSPKPQLGKAALIVFAGDHGIVAEGVTAYPSDVTSIVAQMILDGIAGANIVGRAVSADVFLVNAGLRTTLDPHPNLIDRQIRTGTANALQHSAMTLDEATRAVQAGSDAAADLVARGYGILALGEIGIGNSSAAALVAHAVTSISLDALVGPGAGVPPKGLAHKLDVLTRSYSRAPVRGGLDALREFGGVEMAMLAGAMIGGARMRAIVLVDGFIATACACAAIAMEPNLRDYLVYAHLSPDPGHRGLLNHLDANPLLDLGMRLGEGTGAAMAIPLVRTAEGLLNSMADLP